MASLKPVVITTKNDSDETKLRVYIQIIHNRKPDRIKTDIYVLKKHWTGKDILEGRSGDPNAKSKNIALQNKVREYEQKLLSDDIKLMTVKEVKALLTKTQSKLITNFFDYTHKRINELSANPDDPTIHFLNTTLDNIYSFWGSYDLDFSQITVAWLDAFETYHENYSKGREKGKTGKSKSSINIYLRYIRSMFNDAIDEYNIGNQVVILHYPFRKKKIKTPKAMKRNLMIETIKKIRDYAAVSEIEKVAIDMFMLDFYLLGINSKDLFYLKAEYIVNGRIMMDRYKTKRFQSIKIEPEAMAIFEKYKGEKYMLKFADYAGIKPNVKHAKVNYRYQNHTSFLRMINNTIQAIQVKLVIEGKPITTYYIRHSVATLMRKLGIAKDDISLAMGHTDPEQNLRVTSGYIEEDFEKADIANRKLIDLLVSP